MNQHQKIFLAPVIRQNKNSSSSLLIISGLKTNFNPSLSYSAHKSFNTDHNISIAHFIYFTEKQKKKKKKQKKKKKAHV